MSAEKDDAPHITMLLMIQHGCEKRLEGHIDPDSKAMDVEELREHRAFAGLASTWMSATNFLHGIDAALKRQQSAQNPNKIVPVRRA